MKENPTTINIPQNEEKSNGNSQNNKQYLLFYFCLNLCIDITITLTNDCLYLLFIIKAIITLFFIVVIAIWYNKINNTALLLFSTIIKIYASILVVFTPQKNDIIFAFITQKLLIENNKNHNIDNYCDVIITFSCLIITSINFNLQVFVIMICVQLITIFRYFYFNNIYKTPELQQNKQNQDCIKENIEQNEFCISSSHQFGKSLLESENRDTRETKLSNQIKETLWFNRIEQIPMCLVLISLNDLKITFKNSYCYKLLDKICQREEDIESLLMEQLTFLIIQYQNVEDKVQSPLFKEMEIKKINTIKTRIQSNEQVDQEELTTFTKKSISSKKNLTTILSNIQEGKIKGSINYLNKKFDLYCQHDFEDINENRITFSGSLIINNSDDYILLTLNDISEQLNYQEEMIKIEFKSNIVQSFSHELRTPLNSAINFLECSINDQSCSDYVKQQFIKPAQCALRLQQYLINDIVDFTSISNNNLEINIRHHKIGEFVDEVYAVFKKLIEMKQLELYINLVENDSTIITTDFNRVTQILVNLIQNSIKFSQSGTIILRVKTYSLNIIKFTLTDEGQGIDDLKLKKIQKMLKNIEKSQSLQNSNTWCGFGLAISQQLLTRIGPPNLKTLQIKKRKDINGIKAVFYIENKIQQQMKLSEQSSSKTVQQANSIRSTLNQIMAMSQFCPLNGTLVQIHEGIINQNKNLQEEFSKKKSAELSMYCSQVGYSTNLSHLMEGRQHLNPHLIVNQIKDSNNYLIDAQDNQAKIIEYNNLKKKELKNNQQDYKSILKNAQKCKCKKILSVDDEIFNQQSIKMLLNQQGIEVILAYNGEQALEVINQQIPCSQNCKMFLMVLMDYQMPIMDGIETTKRLTQLMKEKKIPKFHIIGLTAFNSKQDIATCLDSGMSDVLNKPLKLKELFEILSVF